MSYQQQQQPPPQQQNRPQNQKLHELLEAIKEEFENVANEASNFRFHKSEFDAKFNQQNSEMQQMRQNVYELEMAHRKMKEAYEDQINRLKSEVEIKDRQLQSIQQQQMQAQQQQHQQQQQQIQAQQQHQQHQQQQQLPGPAPVGLVNGANNLPKPNFPFSKPASQAATPHQQQSQLPTVAAPAAQAQPQPPIQQLSQPTPLPQQLPSAPGPAPAPGVAQQLPPVSSTPGNVASPSAQKTEPVAAPVAPKPEGTPQQTSAQPAAQKLSTPAASTAQPQATPAASTPAIPVVPNSEASAAPASSSTELTTTNNNTTGNYKGYRVPYRERPTHRKQIPPFLLDLESGSVSDEHKKLLQEYFVLYNPALPRTLDVELLHSLDHTSVVCCVSFSKDGKFLATGCNKTTQVYSVETGEMVARLFDDASGTDINAQADLYIRSVCFSPDGKFLATGAEDKVIRIWDLTTRKVTKYLKGHEQDIYSLDFFPDGSRLVSGSGDRTVRIWDVRAGECNLTLSIEDGVTTVAVSPDGKLIAAGSLDRVVRICDASTGFLIERLDSEVEYGTGHKDSVYSVAFTPDGSQVASGSLDRTVKLWSLRSAESPNKNVTTCEVTYIGHKDFVLSVCATPDNEYLLSGSKDRGVIFWDKNSGDALLMLQGHRNSVISVSVANKAISGAGMFATGSGDCKARIWRWVKK
ncbi:hypothetical protein WICPIJ_002468 [Wickerhamomyces pijperi]|uniref:Transcriptional repressor Tup1 N-terminal domain-containing protein n=1 Tax=Wickerhamomyces pijperi TaxID=599730 RepID=A0A9P8Q9R1_WICPI|nr:hypothetical protein WICPIJ_002468 [Wickerhamomyces pijperi]